MAAWMMLSASLRPIPIDFEWNECGVNVMVRVCLMDIERGREWVRVDGWCQFRRVSIGAAYATGLLLRGRPGISTRREGTRTCGRGILAVYDETKNRKSPDAG